MLKKELRLDDFEHNDIHHYETNHLFVKSYDLSISKEQAKVGERSLKLTYDFGGWTSGNGGMYIVFKRRLVSTRRPVKFGRSEEHTSELQSRGHLVCRLLLEKK